jgi:hypothetical protein
MKNLTKQESETETVNRKFTNLKAETILLVNFRLSFCNVLPSCQSSNGKLKKEKYDKKKETFPICSTEQRKSEIFSSFV